MLQSVSQICLETLLYQLKNLEFPHSSLLIDHSPIPQHGSPRIWKGSTVEYFTLGKSQDDISCLYPKLLGRKMMSRWGGEGPKQLHDCGTKLLTGGGDVGPWLATRKML